MILDKLRCKCTECDCHKEFESINGEELLNVLQHGGLNPKQIEFAKSDWVVQFVNNVLLENILTLSNDFKKIKKRKEGFTF